MTITYVLNALARRWLILALAVVLGALAGGAFAAAAPNRYAATASLVVLPVVSNPLTGVREEVNIRTEQEILGSPEVARRAAESLGRAGTDTTPWADVEIAAPSGSQILQVQVRADTPQKAADSANAIATSYLELRQEDAARATDQYLEEVDQQIEDLSSETSTPANAGLIERLQQQRSSVALSEPSPGRIIGEAAPPTGPSGPGLTVTLAGGTMAGLLLGIAVALLRERLDPKIRSADRLALAIGPVPVISSRSGDHAQWMRLADEVLRRSGVDTSTGPVRVLLHSSAPIVAETAEREFLSAARRVLEDRSADPIWEQGGSSVETAIRPDSRCVAIVRSGSYRTSLVQAARSSDIAVIIATPGTVLDEVTDLIVTLQECQLEAVVGLVPEPRVRQGASERAREDAPMPRHRSGSTDAPEAGTVAVEA